MSFLITYAGVSRPPTVWHNGPGVRLKAGTHVWWVTADEWPDYIVRAGRFSVMIAACRPERVARVRTGNGKYEEVPFARLFVSKQDAEAEALVLREFAVSQLLAAPKSRLRDKCEQVVNVSNKRRG